MLAEGDIYKSLGQWFFDHTVKVSVELSGSGLLQAATVPINTVLVFLDAKGGKGVDVYTGKPKKGDSKDRVLIDKKVLELVG